ncbi:MAG: phosphoglycolate phosphatase/dihydroneopterin aldolase [Verrucomicrobia bacterium]|jgi:dihydroneopterin aldolase|nr:MAG: phosphoglycolate phosphatase/dihydroneopterin aldolase [Verrucomicrobiota bacterium]
MDRIRLNQLRVTAHIGVGDDERRRSQALEIDLELTPLRDWGSDLGDDVGRTIDYFTVSEWVRDLAADRPRRLIETLALELAEGLLQGFALREVEVTVRKFILTDAGSVEVVLKRTRGEA